mmetsp:Transcript_5570/g.14135  ORF Transcript_5570/g.14135 Transcript_5570/m.14135 type:complete len:230 (+) Transcript_5570:684-1373(+)
MALTPRSGNTSERSNMRFLAMAGSVMCSTVWFSIFTSCNPSLPYSSAQLSNVLCPPWVMSSKLPATGSVGGRAYSAGASGANSAANPATSLASFLAAVSRITAGSASLGLLLAAAARMLPRRGRILALLLLLSRLFFHVEPARADCNVGAPAEAVLKAAMARDTDRGEEGEATGRGAGAGGSAALCALRQPRDAARPQALSQRETRRNRIRDSRPAGCHERFSAGTCRR